MDSHELANSSLVVNTSSAIDLNNVNNVDLSEVSEPVTDHVEIHDPTVIPGLELTANEPAVTSQEEILLPSVPESSSVEQRRSTRRKNPPAWMKDYE